MKHNEQNFSWEVLTNLLIQVRSHNHGLINRDKFYQCDSTSDIMIWMSTIKGYFKFLVLLLPPPAPYNVGCQPRKAKKPTTL